MATTKKTAKKAAPKAATKATTVKKKAPAKKAPAKKAAVKKAPAKKPAAKKPAAASTKIKVTAEQHYKMVCEAAYYISLERTHDTVNPEEDWIQAEAAINQIYTIS